MRADEDRESQNCGEGVPCRPRSGGKAGHGLPVGWVCAASSAGNHGRTRTILISSAHTIHHVWPGVSGNKTKLRPWSMATSMTMANATHSGGKVESVAIHDFIKSDNGRSRSRLCVSLSGLHSDRVGQSAVAKQGQLAAQAANASAWPALRESRADDDGQLSRFALLRLVGLDGSRTSRECSSNTQGGSVSRDGKQPLAITSSRTHAGKLAEATRIKGMLILRSAARGRKPKDRSLRPLVPAPGPLRPKPRLRLSAGPWLPRRTAPCFPLRAWICFNSLEKACCVSPQACKPNTGIIGFRVRGRTKCQPQTLIRAAWNSVSSKEKETLTRLLRFALAAQCARLDWLAADRSRLSKPRGSLLIALSQQALSLVGWIRRAVRRRAMQKFEAKARKIFGGPTYPSIWTLQALQRQTLANFFWASQQKGWLCTRRRFFFKYSATSSPPPRTLLFLFPQVSLPHLSFSLFPFPRERPPLDPYLLRLR